MNEGLIERSESINLTNGASYGAAGALLQTTLPHTGYTRQAFIVSPTYFLINSVFLDAGFAGKLTAVAEEPGQGLDFEFLQAELERHDALAESAGGVVTVPRDAEETLAIYDSGRPHRKLYRYVLYLVPTYSNPGTSTMPLEDRRRLLALARKHDMLILCDDVYDMLAYPGSAPAPPRIVTLDRASLADPALPGNTISNCTFSKLLGPGLRVGWQETASPVLASQSLAQGGAVRSGGTPSHLNSMIVGELLSLGLADPIIAGLAATYKARAAAFKAAARKYLPEGTVVYGGDGGYFLWVKTPPELDARDVELRCKQRGVILANGNHFEVHGDHKEWGKTSQRISISYLDEDQITEGVKIWGQVCSELLAKA